MIRRLRENLNYANVVASIALFVALGGTSYALTLPRNSVGSKQIRARAVGASELRGSAVRGPDVRDRSLGLRELSLSARASLRGQTGPVGPIGPPGPTHRVVLDSGGGLVRGDPSFYTRRNVGEYLVEFGLPAADCVPTASLSGEKGVPAPGRITVAREGNSIIVRTYDASGAAKDAAFALIAAC